MKRKLPIVILLVASAGASSFVAAQEVIPAFAFRGETTFKYEYNPTDGSVWSGDALWNTEGCMVAPVILDNGVDILGVSADVYDNLSTNFTLQLRRHTILATSPDSEVVAEIQTTGASTSIVRLTAPSITHPTVDNASYEYYLTTTAGCLAAGDAGHKIYGVRITHSGPIFSDGFESGDDTAWSATQPPPALRAAAATSGSHLITIPAAAFYTEYTVHGLNSWYGIDSAGGYYVSWGPNNGQIACHVAPVLLPDGAILWWMKAYLYDHDASHDVTVTLRRKNYKDATSSEVMASVSTSGDTDAVTMHLTGISQPTIDNGNYTYYLEACELNTFNDATSPDRVYGVTLDYTD